MNSSPAENSTRTFSYQPLLAFMFSTNTQRLLGFSFLLAVKEHLTNMKIYGDTLGQGKRSVQDADT